MTAAAVFLDRDGVLVRDTDLVTRAEQLALMPRAAEALRELKAVGFKLVVVSNQAVVARGMIAEKDVAAIHARLAEMLVRAGGPGIDGWYFCPHHPNATVEAYRVDCECRKPKPGMLLRAARELGLDLKASFLVGDRVTDILAGQSAGCRTALVETGKHAEQPIETSVPVDVNAKADFTCAGLAEAARWILQQQRK